jgi:hypothetical protein
MRHSRIITPAVFLCIVALFPRAAFAARIYFSPEAIQAHVGDTATVDVMLDTEQQSVNAVDLTILYPRLVSVQHVTHANSVLSLWIGEPNVTATSIVLQGGVPSGIVTDHGVIARLVVRANAVGQGGIALDPSSKVLLNDGAGTFAPLTAAPAAITVVARASSATPAVAASAPVDTTQPEGFSINIGSDPSVFGGKSFASFFTTDAGSGMDHYEISEAGGVYRVARSPFLLADQRLHSVIRVRAYDAAGNVREAVWPGFFHRLWWWIIGIFGFH